MSQQAIEAILGRAVLDGEFRSALLGDPDSALTGYDLTVAEGSALAAMGVETLGVFAGALDQRISKSAAIGPLMEDGITVMWPDGSYNTGVPVWHRLPAFKQMGHLPEAF